MKSQPHTSTQNPKSLGTRRENRSRLYSENLEVDTRQYPKPPGNTIWQNTQLLLNNIQSIERTKMIDVNWTRKVGNLVIRFAGYVGMELFMQLLDRSRIHDDSKFLIANVIRNIMQGNNQAYLQVV